MPRETEKCIFYVLGIEVLLLLSNQGFKGGDDNVIVSKNQCLALVGAVKSHPR